MAHGLLATLVADGPFFGDRHYGRHHWFGGLILLLVLIAGIALLVIALTRSRHPGPHLFGGAPPMPPMPQMPHGTALANSQRRVDLGRATRPGRDHT
jgi:hypothetical protein